MADRMCQPCHQCHISIRVSAHSKLQLAYMSLIVCTTSSADTCRAQIKLAWQDRTWSTHTQRLCCNLYPFSNVVHATKCCCMQVSQNKLAGQHRNWSTHSQRPCCDLQPCSISVHVTGCGCMSVVACRYVAACTASAEPGFPFWAGLHALAVVHGPRAWLWHDLDCSLHACHPQSHHCDPGVHLVTCLSTTDSTSVFLSAHLSVCLSVLSAVAFFVASVKDCSRASVCCILPLCPPVSLTACLPLVLACLLVCLPDHGSVCLHVHQAVSPFCSGSLQCLPSLLHSSRNWLLLSTAMLLPLMRCIMVIAWL